MFNKEQNVWLTKKPEESAKPASDGVKNLAHYLVFGGVWGKKFVARGIIAGDGTFDFDHAKGIPRQGKDVYEVLHVAVREYRGAPDAFKQYAGALVRTSREGLTFTVNLVDHVHDLEATIEQAEQAKTAGWV